MTDESVVPKPWSHRLARALELSLAAGDMPMPQVVRNFIRDYARDELKAFEEADRGD